MDRRMTRMMTVGVAVMVCVGLVQAAEKPSAEHVAAMKTFNAANGKLRPLLAAETKDFAAIGAVAAEWKAPAEMIAKFWGGRNAEVGTKMSAEVLKAVTALATAAKASDAAAVTAAGTVLTSSCRTCHTAHRTERLPDGTYEIK
jgi:cytochrome c556